MAEEKAEKSAPKLLIFNYAGLGVLCQLEFPETVPVPRGQKSETPFTRSCEGAIHLRPGSTVMLTEQEHELIKARNPDVAKHLHFVAVNESREDKVERMKQESAAVHNAPPPGPPPGSASSGAAASEGSGEGGGEPSGKKTKGKQGGSGD